MFDEDQEDEQDDHQDCLRRVGLSLMSLKKPSAVSHAERGENHKSKTRGWDELEKKTIKGLSLNWNVWRMRLESWSVLRS